MRVWRYNIFKETPYLRRWLPNLPVKKNDLVLDLGCGNLRNTHFARKLGFKHIRSIDAAGDFGIQATLGTDPIPANDKSVGLVLCNYLLCFMNDRERAHLIEEIKRVSRIGTHIVLEMYPTRNGTPYSMDKIIQQLGWTVLHRIKDRFIARRDK